MVKLCAKVHLLTTALLGKVGSCLGEVITSCLSYETTFSRFGNFIIQAIDWKERKSCDGLHKSGVLPSAACCSSLVYVMFLKPQQTCRVTAILISDNLNSVFLLSTSPYWTKCLLRGVGEGSAVNLMLVVHFLKKWRRKCLQMTNESREWGFSDCMKIERPNWCRFSIVYRRLCHGRLARWRKWRVCDVGEAKEGLESEQSSLRNIRYPQLVSNTRSGRGMRCDEAPIL